MAEQQPFMKFGRDILAADKRASREKGKDKDGKYGPRPSERLTASAVMMLLGIGFEKASEKLFPATKKIAETKLGLNAGDLDAIIPNWAKEAVTDTGVALAYAIVQSKLDVGLPKLKSGDLLTLGIDVACYGGDRLVDRVANKIRTIRVGDSNEQTSSRLELFSKLTDWLNPVTAGAVREGVSAGMDLWNAYRDVVNGVPEKAEEKKEPVNKETTIIFLGNDQQLASALTTVAGEQTTS